MKRRYFPFFAILTIVLGQLVFAGDLSTDIDIKKVEEIEIKSSGAYVIFQKGNKINVQGDAKVELIDGQLRIKSNRGFFSMFGGSRIIVRVGNEKKYKKIDISGSGVTLTGDVKTDRFNVDGSGVELQINLEVNRLSIDGSGVTFYGMVTGRYIDVDGAGIVIEAKLKEVERVSIDGAGVTAKLKYLDSWKGIRSIDIDGVGGTLNVSLPKENNFEENGELDIKVDGNINVDVEKY